MNAARLVHLALTLLITAAAQDPLKGRDSGAVDTERCLNEFLHRDHTMTAWRMHRFSTAISGTLLSNNGAGTYFIRQLNYRGLNGGAQKRAPSACESRTP